MLCVKNSFAFLPDYRKKNTSYYKHKIKIDIHILSVKPVKPLTNSVSPSLFWSCSMFSNCSRLRSWCFFNSAFSSSTCCWYNDSCCLAWKRSAAVLLWLVFRRVSPACSCDFTIIIKCIKIRMSEHNYNLSQRSTPQYITVGRIPTCWN